MGTDHGGDGLDRAPEHRFGFGHQDREQRGVRGGSAGEHGFEQCVVRAGAQGEFDGLTQAGHHIVRVDGEAAGDADQEGVDLLLDDYLGEFVFVAEFLVHDRAADAHLLGQAGHVHRAPAFGADDPPCGVDDPFAQELAHLGLEIRRFSHDPMVHEHVFRLAR